MSERITAFNGKRLRSARLYNGLTIADVAGATNISKQSISQFETGKMEPKMETIMKLAVCLGFPREFFYQKIKDKVLVGDTYFRSLSTTTNKERLSQIEKIKILVGLYKVIQEYVFFPELNLYKVPENDEIDVEDLATKVRQHWGLKQEPITNIINLMERNGVIMSSATTSISEKGTKIDAFSQIQLVNNNPVAVVILGSDKDNAFRRNFNAAHELGHLILDDYYNVSDMSKLEYKEMEDNMNRFAGALLIPSETYQKDLNTSSKSDLGFYIQLKKKYKVSAAALIVRAKQLDLISTNQYQYLMKQLSIRGYRTCEPFDKETPTIKPRYLKEAMKMIIEEDKVSSLEFIGDLSAYGLTILPEMIERVLNLPDGYLSLNDSKCDVISLHRKI